MLFGNEAPFHLKPIPYRGVRKHQAEVLQHPPGYKHPIIPLPPCSALEVTAVRPSGSGTAAHLSRSSASLSPASSVNSGSTPGTLSCTSSNRRAVDPAAASALYRVAPPNLLQQQQHNPRMRRDSGRGGDAFLADAERLDPDITADAALRQERVCERRKLRAYQQARRERAASREATLQASRNAAFEAECRRLANVAGTARSNREQDDRDPITHQCYTAEAEQLLMDRNSHVRTRYAARQRFLDRQMNSTEYNILTWQLR
ncbi:hypothetical protein conserved [Leishmania donovani]|uniref:Hypothetical_protein_conserved n=1 Tax=Leishmania donovani TaxID=5661 RepID=A0A504XLX6_LEIDO|nr:hypothetical protein CGC20_32405 [Leishmania donovani]CAJ1990071.1 hypothetical protein conserved [Leishmania donovani]VDZ45928.1 hypothetical_protein_conserved [Leishmania donovani]